jgi:hypothetical protein
LMFEWKGTQSILKFLIQAFAVLCLALTVFCIGQKRVG